LASVVLRTCRGLATKAILASSEKNRLISELRYLTSMFLYTYKFVMTI